VEFFFFLTITFGIQKIQKWLTPDWNTLEKMDKLLVNVITFAKQQKS
jgi:hypothetical protein